MTGIPCVNQVLVHVVSVGLMIGTDASSILIPILNSFLSLVVGCLLKQHRKQLDEIQQRLHVDMAKMKASGPLIYVYYSVVIQLEHIYNIDMTMTACLPLPLIVDFCFKHGILKKEEDKKEEGEGRSVMWRLINNSFWPFFIIIHQLFGFIPSMLLLLSETVFNDEIDDKKQLNNEDGTDDMLDDVINTELMDKYYDQTPSTSYEEDEYWEEEREGVRVTVGGGMITWEYECGLGKEEEGDVDGNGIENNENDFNRTEEDNMDLEDQQSQEHVENDQEVVDNVEKDDEQNQTEVEDNNGMVGNVDEDCECGNGGDEEDGTEEGEDGEEGTQEKCEDQLESDQCQSTSCDLSESVRLTAEDIINRVETIGNISDEVMDKDEEMEGEGQEEDMVEGTSNQQSDIRQKEDGIGNNNEQGEVEEEDIRKDEDEGEEGGEGVEDEDEEDDRDTVSTYGSDHDSLEILDDLDIDFSTDEEENDDDISDNDSDNSFDIVDM